MANITFPHVDGVPVSFESITCELVFPGQQVHESIYTGSIQSVSRGIGRWQGVFAFPQIGRIQGAETIRAIDAFFANVDGTVNTFDLPFPAIDPAQLSAFPDGTDVRVTAIERTGTTMMATMNQASGLHAGYRVTINNQLFVVVNALSGGRCTLSPHRPLVIPTGGYKVNWQTPSLRARLTSPSNPSVTRNVDWVGPWSAAFVDVLV